MPLWLRRFTYEKIKEYYEKQKEEYEKQQNLLNNNSKSKEKVAKLDVSPKTSYSTKATKK